MKKVRVFLTVAAVMIAAAGVFAKEFMDSSTLYYEDTSAPGTCNVQIDQPCTEGTQVPCTSNSHNVWKTVDNGACQQVFRDQ